MPKRPAREVLEDIREVLIREPKSWSIQDMAKVAVCSWESAERYLELFTRLGMVRKTEGNKPAYQIAQPWKSDTLFRIPISEQQRDKIRQIYATIRNVWPSVSKHDLSKTLVQKIAVEVAKCMNIPAPWYLYGRVLLLPEKEESSPMLKDQVEIEVVKKACEEYKECSSTYQVRKRQYEREKNKLYEIKEQLYNELVYGNQNKNIIRRLLNEFAVAPDRTEENAMALAIVEDFCASTLGLFRNLDDEKLKKAGPAIVEAFHAVWQLVAMHEFFQSLVGFYDKEIMHDFLDERLRTLEATAMEVLDNLEEFEPPVEIHSTLKAIMGSAKELSPEEKKAREEELKKMSPSELARKFGLDDV